MFSSPVVRSLHGVFRFTMAASRWSARLLQTAFRIPGAKMRECILANVITANSSHFPFGFAQRASVTTLCAASLVRPWRIQPGSSTIHLPVSALPALQGAARIDNFIPRVSHRGAKTEANKVRSIYMHTHVTFTNS